MHANIAAAANRPLLSPHVRRIPRLGEIACAPPLSQFHTHPPQDRSSREALPPGWLRRSAAAFLSQGLSAATRSLMQGTWSPRQAGAACGCSGPPSRAAILGVCGGGEGERRAVRRFRRHLSARRRSTGKMAGNEHPGAHPGPSPRSHESRLSAGALACENDLQRRRVAPAAERGECPRVHPPVRLAHAGHVDLGHEFDGGGLGGVVEVAEDLDAVDAALVLRLRGRRT